jgi:phospholipid/cholesterol/gamma-HCH transport system substrate-binding protein
LSGKTRPELGVGMLLLVALALFAYMAMKVGGGSMFFGAQTRLAVFEDASGLQVGAPVTVAGVRVGQIDQIAVQENKAAVTIELAKDVVLYNDAALMVMSRSLLGEKYLSLSVGDEAAGVLSPAARISQTTTPLDLTAFVRRIEPFLDALEPEALAEVVSSIRTLVASAAKDPDRMDRIMANLDTLTAAMAETSVQLPQTLAKANSVMLKVGRGADSTKSAAKNVGQFVDDVKPSVLHTVDRMDTTLDSVNQLVLDWDGSGQDVAALLEKLAGIDRADLVGILREEGILIRLKARESVE